jgi:hypothetical protein
VGREGIQKGKTISREERPMVLTPKRQKQTNSQNKQEIVCFFSIEKC